MEDIVQIIQTLGFPIALCCYLLYDRNKSDQRHQEEISTLKESLDANTQMVSDTKTMIQTFMDYMAKMQMKGEE